MKNNGWATPVERQARGRQSGRGSPSGIEGIFDQALEAHQQGRLGEAEKIYRAILPDCAEAFYNPGIALYHTKRLDDACTIGDFARIPASAFGFKSTASLEWMMRGSPGDGSIGCSSPLSKGFPVMDLDPHGLELAKRTLDRLLTAEAAEQRAYLYYFPDGRISLELEWIDIHSIVRTVIATYVDHVNGAPRS